MNQKSDTPKLLFARDFSLLDEQEMLSKGYKNGVVVELPDKRQFAVCFYDPVRLSQDIKEEKFIAEVGLIVTEQVTKEKMRIAVTALWNTGFFDSFVPINL
jgi:hypothetical protein